MTAKSPVWNSDQVLSVIVKVNGSLIKDECTLISVLVKHTINHISSAEIVIAVTFSEPGEFSDDFSPGKKLEIFAGYGNDKALSIFTGIIERQSIQINSSSYCTFTVTCQHKALVKSSVRQSPVLRLTLGDSILSFHAELNTAKQPKYLLTGNVTFYGSAVSPGKIIELEGLGIHFSGKVPVSAVHHTIENGIWQTNAAFGLTDKPVFEEAAFSEVSNYTKSLASKNHLKLSFDDKKKIIKLETPGGNLVSLGDDSKSVELKDQNGNTIKMTPAGIVMQSSKDITIKASGNISLEATGKLHLGAKNDVDISGLNINNIADIGFIAKGNATAEISASGQTVVKGAIVMIN